MCRARHSSQPDVYKTDFIKHKTVALAPIKFEHLWNCKEKEEPNHLKCKLCFKELETKSVHLNLQPSVHFNSFWHTDKWRDGANKPKCNGKENIGFDEFPLFVGSVTGIYNPWVQNEHITYQIWETLLSTIQKQVWSERIFRSEASSIFCYNFTCTTHLTLGTLRCGSNLSCDTRLASFILATIFGACYWRMGPVWVCLESVQSLWQHI